ncbi:MAG: XRE family transcriptional regulator [Bacteroidales bacterium]|nr:XRE family transcriptional regulator [Bacteroidales bacterium]
MAQIKNETQYKAACQRIEELLKVVSNDTPNDDKNLIELDLISDLVADYEELHYPIMEPARPKLRNHSVYSSTPISV